MASLYSTKVTASGGRHGSIRSEDGLLDLKLALPRALGGSGDATNPEQLFAGGYAACFENALLHVSRDAGHRFADDDIDVVARIDLGRNETGAFVLAAALAVTMAGIDKKTAERLVEGAHASCPEYTELPERAREAKRDSYRARRASPRQDGDQAIRQHLTM
jgi:lipoyl-dependent peroxiredoxin